MESRVRKGSSFSFTVKCQSRDEFSKKARKKVRGLRDKHVLVVDDNPDNRIIFTDMLFGAKMRPVACGSAKEALKLLTRYDFAIGLIDICMPGMSGTDLAAQIKEEIPTLPLIAVSSLDEVVNTTHFEQTLYKPVHQVQLLLAMEKIIGGSMKSIYIDEDTCSDESTSSGGSTPDPDTIKIMITDDKEDNIDVLRHMLNTLGYSNIDDSRNGQEAIEMIDSANEEKEPYDVLLLDLRMPVKDGFQVIEHLNEKNYRIPKIAVVTASVLDQDRDRCKELGIKYFILKPINVTQVRSVMSALTRS